MSELRVTDVVNEAGTGAVGFSKGINIASGVVTATTFKGDLTGTVTGNATGLTGTPNVTVGLLAAQDVTVGGSTTITGNLTVDGTQTIINTSTLDVSDTTVGIASTTTASDTTANGAGIEIYASSGSLSNNKTLKWSSTGYNWTFAKGGLVVSQGGANITGIVTATGFSGPAQQVPINTQGGTYTLVASDAGKAIGAGGAVTVDDDVFAAGDIISVVNATAGTLALTQGSGVTLRKSGSATTGSLTIKARGVVTLIALATDDFYVAGNLS